MGFTNFLFIVEFRLVYTLIRRKHFVIIEINILFVENKSTTTAMKKFIFLCLLVLTIGCSKDNEDSIASLKVTVVDSNDALVSGAIITTTPETKTGTTNSQGVAIIDNVPLGEYTIKVHILNDPLDYPTTVSITESKEHKKTIITMAAPDPIEEGDPKIAAFVQQANARIKSLTIFGAEGYLYYWGSAGTDEVLFNEKMSWYHFALDTYQIDPGNSYLYGIWNNHYSLIALVNEALDQIADLDRDLTPKELSQKAELVFVRALMYFNLTKIYGNPLIIEHYNPDGNLSDIPQGGKAAYNLIINDLLFSKENMDAFSSSALASKEAATALLGKVYLQSAGFPLLITENYNKALEQFTELEGKFSLAPEYATLFNTEGDSENEIIFKIDYDSSIDEGGNFGIFWGPIGYPKYDGLKLSPTTIKDYFDGNSVPTSPVSFPLNVSDNRFYQNIATFKVESGQKVNLENIKDWRPYKGVEDVSTPVEWGQQDFDFIILRYADVLLMQAEAINEIYGPNEKAYALVNQIRRRAYGDNEHDLVKGMDKAAFTEALLTERKKEFFMEGHRKDDLVRMQALEEVINTHNQFPDVIQKDYQVHEYIWPISQRELDNNQYIDQNPGY